MSTEWHMTAVAPEKVSIEGPGGMARAEGLLPDDQGALEELFRLHVLPLGYSGSRFLRRGVFDHTSAVFSRR
jgi:hypothetical protein